MPGMKSSHRNDELDASYFLEAKASIKKRMALLSLVDYCFYSMAFFVLTIMPVNAAVKTVDNASNINIYAAHLSTELTRKCDADRRMTCQFNVVDQAALLDSLLTVNANPQDKEHIIDALQSTDYELLVGSATIARTVNGLTATQLAFEITAQWRGITIDDSQLLIKLNGASTDASDELSLAISELLTQWIAHAGKQGIFSAEHLYSTLGASDYLKELKVPSNIGDFQLSRQHLFNDPMKGMLTRYIHKDFNLAVLDVYVYPLKAMSSLEEESKNELRLEQNDIQTISQSLGESALNMSAISEVKGIQGIENFRVYGFEATLKTPSDPLFATQYVFVKNDKVVRLSANVPARIAHSLVAFAVNAIEVPAESFLMKQVRQVDVEQFNRSHKTNVAP